MAPQSCTAQYPNQPTVDVDGTLAAYAEARCPPSRLVVIDLARRLPRRVFTTNVLPCCSSARIAGRYLAWAGRPAVVVYDWKARRLADRFSTSTTPVDFDVQADGKVVALMSDHRVTWFSPAQPRPHVLPVVAADTAREVRIAGDRIVFVRERSADQTQELVLTNLSGRVTRIAHFGAPDRLSIDSTFQSEFVFDGRRVTWASDHVTESDTVCPPLPAVPPCYGHEKGTRTIWLERVGGPARALTRLPFENPPTG